MEDELRHIGAVMEIGKSQYHVTFLDSGHPSMPGVTAAGYKL